jgi:hypothetical protein
MEAWIGEGHIVQSIRDKDGAHARLAPRFKTFQPASIDCEGAKRRAHILDVSARGARLYCADALPVGSYLALQCCDVTLSARIVWTKEQRFGVEFQFPLPDAHMRRILDPAAHGQ